MIKTLVSMLALTVSIGIAVPATAQDVDFSGQTIKLIVPYGPGGGSTVHARVLAPLLEDELPGNPSIVIENIEGGGSVRGLNQFVQEAKPDGLTIGATGTGSYYNYMLGAPTVQYPLPDFIPFLASPGSLVAYGRKDLGLTGDGASDIKLLQENPPTYAGDGAGSGDLAIVYCLDLLGIEAKGVWGLSRGEARQAFQRGESQLNSDNLATWNTDIQPMIDDGLMVPLFTLGFRDANGVMGRDPTRPEVPTCLELYEAVNGTELTGIQREIWEAIITVRMAVAKALVLPPGTPTEIVQVYDEAMKRVVARPELQTPEAQMELGGYPQILGEEARKGHQVAANLSAEAKAELLRWLKERWGVEI